MKKFVVALAAVVAVVSMMFCGCGQSKPVLHLYNWSDYIDPEVVSEFEAKFNCRVVTDTFDSNESMFAKLKAGATGYDIVFPSSYMVSVMHEQGLLQEIDTSKIPNLANLDKGYDSVIADPSYKISVPYMVSNAGIAYNKERCPDFEASWAMFGNTKYNRACTLLNDMRETIGAALKSLGYSFNTTNEAEVAEAADLVIEWSKNIAKFDNELYKNGIASGHFVFVHGYNGDLGQVIDENENIVYALPKEGVSIACDEMVILRSAKEVELAYAFINFVHDAAIAARNMEYTCFLCPNVKSYELLPEEVRSNEAIFIPENIRDKSETIRDLGENNRIYIKAWDRIKAAQ